MTSSGGVESVMGADVSWSVKKAFGVCPLRRSVLILLDADVERRIVNGVSAKIRRGAGDRAEAMGAVAARVGIAAATLIVNRSSR